MATAQAIGSRFRDLFLDSMAESLAKLVSCVAYARRSCYKAGFGRIASKLTPVILELKAEMDLLSAEPAERMEVGRPMYEPCCKVRE